MLRHRVWKMADFPHPLTPGACTILCVYVSECVSVCYGGTALAATYVDCMSKVRHHNYIEFRVGFSGAYTGFGEGGFY